MADIQDLKSWGCKKPCGFESHHRHQTANDCFAICCTDRRSQCLTQQLLWHYSATTGKDRVLFDKIHRIRSTPGPCDFIPALSVLRLGDLLSSSCLLSSPSSQSLLLCSRRRSPKPRPRRSRSLVSIISNRPAWPTPCIAATTTT